MRFVGLELKYTFLLDVKPATVIASAAWQSIILQAENKFFIESKIYFSPSEHRVAI
jgi:hypothetical protein